MKRIIPLLFAALLCSCNNANTPDPPEEEIPQHQPADSTTWSPKGKIYICDRSEDNIDGYPYYIEVIEFFDNVNAAWYGSINDDLSPLDKYYNQAIYTCNYPNVELVFGADKRPLYFKDTLTLRSDWWNQTYTLLH